MKCDVAWRAFNLSTPHRHFYLISEENFDNITPEKKKTLSIRKSFYVNSRLILILFIKLLNTKIPRIWIGMKHLNVVEKTTNIQTYVLIKSSLSLFGLLQHTLNRSFEQFIYFTLNLHLKCLYVMQLRWVKR